MERRTFIKTASLAAATTMSSKAFSLTPGGAKNVELRPSLFYVHEPAKLPFKAGSLKGLSEKLIVSHWENNYKGSVKVLNEVRKKLAEMAKAKDAPAWAYNDLKREHLLRTGSVVNHELYFENLGGDGKAGGKVQKALADSFGSFSHWEEDFRKIASGLGGGSGWVVLGYNKHLKLLENYWAHDHMHGTFLTEPLLVLDMYEHSYHLDYGAAAAKYIDAFFKNINWDIVEKRYEIIV